MNGYQHQPAMAIDPKAAEQREMQQRSANVNFAAQVVLSMLQGKSEAYITSSPEDIFTYAIRLSEQMAMYLNRPFDEPNRLVS